jgi:hypothetical protein
MKDEVWKEFFTDNETRRSLESSEVFMSYAKSELQRDELKKKARFEEKVNTENSIMEEVEIFREVVANSPELKERFKMAKAALEAHPELAEKVDPDFIRGLELIHFELEEE